MRIPLEARTIIERVSRRLGNLPFTKTLILLCRDGERWQKHVQPLAIESLAEPDPQLVALAKKLK